MDPGARSAGHGHDPARALLRKAKIERGTLMLADDLGSGMSREANVLALTSFMSKRPMSAGRA